MLILECTLVLAATAVLLVARTPQALRHVAAALVARAEALEAYREAMASGVSYWRTRLEAGAPGQPRLAAEFEMIRARLEGR